MLKLHGGKALLGTAML